MIENIKNKFVFLFQKGLFHIFGTSIVNNIIQFITNIFIVNLVSKSEYGVYTYANNIISFFLVLRGIGLCTGLLQFASEEKDSLKKQEIFSYVLKRGNQFNIALSIVIAIGVSCIEFKFEGAKKYLYFMLLLPVFQWMFDYVTTVFRTKQDNISYAKIINLNSILYFVFSVIGTFFFDALGIVIGRYIAFILSCLIAILWLKEDFKEIIKFKSGNYRDRKEIMKFSITSCANNSLSELLYLLDVFLIGIFVVDPSYIASYKVATQIPTALAFIPSGIITFVYPYFALNNKNIDWIKEKFSMLIKALALLNGVICFGLYIFSPFIIEILWGNEYLDALVPFRILIVNYFFLGTFRIPCGNVLAMLRKVDVNFYISIISSISNIILDVILIGAYGANGAAIATLTVVLISGGLSFGYLIKLIYSESRRKYE